MDNKFVGAHALTPGWSSSASFTEKKNGWGWEGWGGEIGKAVFILLSSLYFPHSMQHYGVNGYSLHAMNSLSAMYNLHQQAAQQAQHAPDYRPSVHALTLAERLAGNCVHVRSR